ncbi:ATP-binding cassette domain-containing protein [Micromonospora sp. NPDC047548]|uniref:ATP-binding cassette domain-containing protein n=1 Tax=Micromonospora sp. NPDC047548 TaxID=3155624 RepID=UPI0033F92A67
MLAISNLQQGYGLTTVIKDLTLYMEHGIHALLGPNGAGKSTFLRTLATIVPPRRGRIRLDDHELGPETLEQIRGRIGYLPQRFGFDPSMTVSEFVHYAAWARGVPRPARRAAVEEALEKTGLGDRRAVKMRKLSGGMVQRSGIAWAIVGNPSLILLDEPTVGLDPMQRIRFRSIISQQRDAVIVLSTHLTDDVDAIAEKVIVMDEGTARFQGSPGELEKLANPDSPGNTPLERGYTTLLAGSKER